MPIPDAVTLIETYYAMYFGLPIAVVATLTVGVIICSLFYAVGYQSALKYVWYVGEKHSQKEHEQLYKKWVHGIRD